MKFGILLAHLNNNQGSFFLVNYINYLCDQGSPHDFIIFLENLISPTVLPKCATLPVSEVHGYDGILLATSFQNCRYLTKLTCPATCFFYVSDLYWIRGPYKNFLDTVSVFRNKRINLIAQSEEHKILIEQYCNKRVWGVVENYNLMDFIEKLEKINVGMCRLLSKIGD